MTLCKMDMFDYWLRSTVHASWKMIVVALEEMEGYNHLAHSLRVKYGLGPSPGEYSVGYWYLVFQLCESVFVSVHKRLVEIVFEGAVSAGIVVMLTLCVCVSVAAQAVPDEPMQVEPQVSVPVSWGFVFSRMLVTSSEVDHCGLLAMTLMLPL